MDKRGFELAINMIVVIILGIVLLGMGIYFVTMIIDRTTELSGKVEGRLIDELRRERFSSGQKVALLNAEESVARGKTARFVLGFVNKQGEELDFRVVTEYSTNSPGHEALLSSEKMKATSGWGTMDDKAKDAEVKKVMDKLLLHLFMIESSTTVTLKSNVDDFYNLIFSPPRDLPPGQYFYTVYVCRERMHSGYETITKINDLNYQESYDICVGDNQNTPMLYGNKQRLIATVK